jgi:uncharacterized protein (DUF1330 family)
MNTAPPAYAVAYLEDIRFGPDLITYLERIDATLEPHGGTFLVHGGDLIGVEGRWDGQLVVIRFPSERAALAWYHSPAYQEILPLRTNNTCSRAAISGGVPQGYRAIAGLAAILDQNAQPGRPGAS